jgi:hypothetical protein
VWLLQLSHAHFACFFRHRFIFYHGHRIYSVGSLTVTSISFPDITLPPPITLTLFGVKIPCGLSADTSGSPVSTSFDLCLTSSLSLQILIFDLANPRAYQFSRFQDHRSPRPAGLSPPANTRTLKLPSPSENHSSLYASECDRALIGLNLAITISRDEAVGMPNDGKAKSTQLLIHDLKSFF